MGAQEITEYNEIGQFGVPARGMPAQHECENMLREYAIFCTSVTTLPELTRSLSDLIEKGASIESLGAAVADAHKCLVDKAERAEHLSHRFGQSG